MIPPNEFDQHIGSLWRDNNDHVFRVDSVLQTSDGWYMLDGVTLYCACGMESQHLDKPYCAYAEPDDDLEGGEIFGWTRMWP